jgi:hypothetical protein
MKVYHIQREGEERSLGAVTVKVHEHGFGESYDLPLEPSLKVRNHSPTGFEFGYGGSGPAQLALAILLDYMGRPPSPGMYQAFKFFFIAPMGHPGGTITGKQIDEFIGRWDAEQEGIYQHE